jgi:hypothetical protein
MPRSDTDASFLPGAFRIPEKGSMWQLTAHDHDSAGSGRLGRIGFKRKLACSLLVAPKTT